MTDFRHCLHRAARVGGLLSILCLVPLAGAQYAVDTRVNTRLPAAPRVQVNPGLYTGGANYVRPQSPLIGGNAFATGNVGGGLSLRSYSPISDPTAFRAPLGSAALSTFRRDSVSPLTYSQAQGLNRDAFVQPYYDPSRTTVTSGYVHGFAGLGANKPRAERGALDFRRTWAVTPDTPEQVISQLNTPWPRSTSAGGPTTSAIFGTENLSAVDAQHLPHMQMQSGLDGLASKWQSGQPTLDELSGFPEQRSRRTLADRLAEQRPAERLRGSLDAESPLDRVLRGQTQEMLADPRGIAGVPGQWQGGWHNGAFRPGRIIRPPADDGAEIRVTELTGDILPKPEDIDPSVLPGYDVFTDMRIALALETSTHAEWFAEMRAAAMAHPDLMDEADQATIADAESFRTGMLESPLRTFTGEGASTLNDLMLKAESLMDIGHYFEAADRYRAAAMLDPTNPLPLIGRGHALLAGGQYRSAVEALLRGLEKFPDMTRFRIDLQALLGGGEEVDIRRADLMRRLEVDERPELRFLLGYVEYHAGDRERGMRHLRQAAEAAPPGSLIARYPVMLQGGTPLPLPRIDIEAPDAPTMTDEDRAPAVDPNQVEERLFVPPAD